MKLFSGIDIGSTSIKIVIIDETERLLAHSTCPSGSHFHHNTMAAFAALLREENLERQQLAYIVATGYGRKLFKDADETISEITANAVGACKVGANGGANGRIKTIINIGGQDLKVIVLDDSGNISNFVMNDKCAAGTGRFLEMTARNLEMDVESLGDYHRQLNGGVPLAINSTCTVFAESEIISLLANGHGKPELIAGVHYSIARRVARLAKRLGIKDSVFFDGGPAMNQGLVLALEDEMMRSLVVPQVPQITTAYGAAILARQAFSGEN